MNLNGKRVTLRPLERSDFPSVVAVYQSNPAYNCLRNGSPGLSLEQWTAEYEETLSLMDGRWLAVCAGEVLIGVSHVRTHHPREGKGWISLILLHADWQRKGLGREAVSLLEGWFQSEGCSQVHTGVITENEPALRFWGALGYEQYRQVPGQVGRLTQPVLLLAKMTADRR